MESQPDESHLIEAARFGDMEAAEALVDAYMDDVFLHILQSLGDPLAAESVAEDALRTMLAQLSDFVESEGSIFGEWLILLADEALARYYDAKGITDAEAP